MHEEEQLLTHLELGLRELCWNNFGNFEAAQYSRIILRVIGEFLE